MSKQMALMQGNEAVAEGAIAAWRARPWLERMAIRLFG